MIRKTTKIKTRKRWGVCYPYDAIPSYKFIFWAQNVEKKLNALQARLRV